MGGNLVPVGLGSKDKLAQGSEGNLIRRDWRSHTKKKVQRIEREGLGRQNGFEKLSSHLHHVLSLF